MQNDRSKLHEHKHGVEYRDNQEDSIKTCRDRSIGRQTKIKKQNDLEMVSCTMDIGQYPYAIRNCISR